MKTPEPRLDWMREVRPESLRAVFYHLPGVLFFAKAPTGRFPLANLPLTLPRRSPPWASPPC